MMNNKLLGMCAVIIRSSSERTEELCKYAIKTSGITDKQIGLIKDVSPFSEALKKGYELALNMNKKYTFFIDADMIIMPDALNIMLQAAERLPENTFFINPLCYDFITGSIVPNGPHLYRTKHIDKALSLVENESKTIRPETHVARQMNDKGHNAIFLDIPLAMHEFEQYYKDLVNRAITKNSKNSQAIKDLKKRIIVEPSNKDLQVTLSAMELSQKEKISTQLDFHQGHELFKRLHIAEKKKITDVQTAYQKLLKQVIEHKDEYNYAGYTQQLLSQHKTSTVGKIMKKIRK